MSFYVNIHTKISYIKCFYMDSKLSLPFSHTKRVFCIHLRFFDSQQRGHLVLRVQMPPETKAES